MNLLLLCKLRALLPVRGDLAEGVPIAWHTFIVDGENALDTRCCETAYTHYSENRDQT
jgi:hypothetical protein